MYLDLIYFVLKIGKKVKKLQIFLSIDTLMWWPKLSIHWNIYFVERLYRSYVRNKDRARCKIKKINNCESLELSLEA